MRSTNARWKRRCRSASGRAARARSPCSPRARSAPPRRSARPSRWGPTRRSTSRTSACTALTSSRPGGRWRGRWAPSEELVIAGNEATDGVGGAVPAIIAEYLGLPQLTHLRKLSVEGGKVTGERETDDGVFTLEATLPAVVSVNEKINEPRFPSFKGIMAAKKKEVTTLTLAEIGVEADEVGVANAGSTVLASTPKPPKTAGEKVADEGEGGNDIAKYLVAQKII